MKLITDLNIMEGLGTCRDKQEAKAYLMANNINLSDQELEALQAHCYTETDCKSTLTASQLSTVAGGGPPVGGAHEKSGLPESINVGIGNPLTGERGSEPISPKKQMLLDMINTPVLYRSAGRGHFGVTCCNPSVFSNPYQAVVHQALETYGKEIESAAYAKAALRLMAIKSSHASSQVIEVGT